jgi:hypothetical protein
MTRPLTSRHASQFSLLSRFLASSLLLAQAQAHQFTIGDVSFDLQEVTTNVDVDFRAVRFNRASNEWDVDLAVSNKSTVTISAPLVYLVDSFAGTSGPLSPDGVSTNQPYFDLSGQIPSGVLAPGALSSTRTLRLGFSTNQTPRIVSRLFSGTQTNSSQALAFVRSLNQVGQPLPAVNVLETGPAGSTSNLTDSVFGVATLGQNPGNYVWQFSRSGYLSVWRQASLQSNSVSVSLPGPGVFALVVPDSAPSAPPAPSVGTLLQPGNAPAVDPTNPPTLPVQVSFPVDLGALGYPTNEAPTNAAAAVAVVRNTQDVTTFEIMDQLVFVPQASAASDF